MALAPSRPPISFGREASVLSLEELVGEARDAFTAEMAIPMTVNQPPALRDRDGHGDVVTEAAEGTQVGLSMSPQLYRRLHSPGTYRNVFPVARALDDLRGWCRGRHLEARNGPWIDHLRDVPLGTDLQRPLCARLAHYAVVWRMQPLWSAQVEQLQVPTVRRLLKGALEHMWDQRRHWALSEDPESGGAAEVIVQLRQEHRQRRQRVAQAATAPPGDTCRYCGGPYDPASTKPCPGDPHDQIDSVDAEVYAAAGFTLLCSPAPPS